MTFGDMNFVDANCVDMTSCGEFVMKKVSCFSLTESKTLLSNVSPSMSLYVIVSP